MNVKACQFKSVRSNRAIQPLTAPRGEKAFTLAEVMVAACILGIASLSMYGGFAGGFMLVDSSRQELRATQILTQKAEALRLCSWSSLTNCPISFSETYDPTSTN